MKRIAQIFSITAIAVVLALPANASDLKKQIGEKRYNMAVENLLLALKSDNSGLTRSSAYVLGELEAAEAVIPLMEALRNSPDESLRIAAAWSLCRIGDARGVYAVRMAVRFDDSKRVQAHCAWYYNLYIQNGTFAFRPYVSPEIELSSK
jgi:HEAT repeat protein